MDILSDKNSTPKCSGLAFAKARRDKYFLIRDKKALGKNFTRYSAKGGSNRPQ